MEFLLDIILFFLKVLTSIGDFTLFILAAFFNFFKFIIKNILGIFIFFIKIFNRIFVKAIAPQGSKLKPAKKRNLKPIVIFPIPLFFKLRYFSQGIVFSLLFIFIPIILFVFLQSLPKPQELTLREIPQTTKIYDRNGTLLFQIYANQNRTIVPLSEIPKNLRDATIAIEDKDFYRHPGFDLMAILRSIRENATGKGLQGGSTITQQLVKSALLSPETTIERKLKEVILAFWTERIYSKNQILEMYFNQIPYGGTAWGAEAASEVYFGKQVKDLDLAQSAFLAGLPKAPTIYSPFGNDDSLWKKRQKEVLDKMVFLSYISKSDADEAKEEELNFKLQTTPIHAPHFVMYVKDLLVKKYGLPMVEKGGLSVITSLDLKLQDKIQKIVTEEVANNSYLNLTNGASLVVSPKNGDILAMVGSKDYSDPNGGNVNVTTSLRQPGSSIKVITYAAALSHGLTAASIIDDSPITYSYPGYPSYSPINYDGKFHGRVPLRLALGNSLNIPAVKTLNQIGVPAMISLAKEMGIKTWNEEDKYGLSITLGGADVTMVDLANAYSVLADGGERIDINPIQKITDYQGNVLEEKQPDGIRVLDPGVTFILSDILADNNARAWEFGTNSPLNIPNHFVSVKTGTSDNKRDNWTFGYTKNYLAAVWVGNNDNSPMSQTLASGITGAAPIWNKIMTMLLQNSKDEKLQAPTNVVQKDCLGRKEYFIKGTENTISCIPLPAWTPTPNP
ncbi:MAG: PBP1A family penicillin-binding protein [bacterium]|nr:PBP1A family penicillin-binding protein [bacterium]